MIHTKHLLAALMTFPITVAAQYAPEIVGVCPGDAYIGLSQLPTGELRYYNYGEQAEPGCFYLSSKDKGATWTKVDYPDSLYFADNWNPRTHTMIRLYQDLVVRDKATWAIRYNASENGTSHRYKVFDESFGMLKPPVFIRGGKRIIVATAQSAPNERPAQACVLYSDDDGQSWKVSEKVRVPLHKLEGFHKGLRWNHGAVEPTVVELKDGRLRMIIRTSQDQHFESYSFDGGETWLTPRPAPFYSTITMPTMARLKDGRLLFVWNNTTPLPELPTADGYWDDVFTNRNVVHAAISEDDGMTWIGCRELFLDARRNAADFGETKGMDKSVHQSQFVETDTGKIVIALGQHTLHRKIMRFDVAWLYENERENHFENGLQDWSTFQYYKGFRGHCGYNRKEGGRLLAHPTKKNAKILNLSHPDNDSLVYAGEGAVWNFPAFMHGKFTTSIRLSKETKGGQLLLNDRWFNPTDTVAPHFAMYTIPLDGVALGIHDTEFHTLSVEWNLLTRATEAFVYVDGKKEPTLRIPLRNNPFHGISYAHFLTSTSVDPAGFDLESVWAKGYEK